MAKKIIVSIVIFLLIAVVAVFLSVKEVKKQEAQNRESLKQQQNNQNQKKEELTWYEVPEMRIRFRVSAGAKNDLGYSFKKHQTLNSEGNIDDTSSAIGTAMFYSKSETDENLSGCTLAEEIGWDCGWFQLSYKIKPTENASAKLDYENCDIAGGIIYVASDNVKLCSIGDPSEGSGNIKNTLYKEFFHISDQQNSEELSIYLDTMEELSE